MAAAKKKAAPKGAASGPTVESAEPAAATPPAAPAAPATPPAAETVPATTPRRKKWDVIEDKIEYVILINGKNALKGLCSSKAGVTRVLEGMAAKDREKAHVFQRVAVELKTKVDIVWG